MYYYDLRESGKRLKEARKAAGFTQESMSEAVGISHDGYKQIEQGRNGASIDTLVVISEILGTTIDYIVTGRKLIYATDESEDCIEE